MMAGLSLAAALVAFACLALAMDRHHRQILQGALSRERQQALRIAGAIGFFASYVSIIAEFGPAIGTIAWFAILSLGAGMTLLAISARDNSK